MEESNLFNTISCIEEHYNSVVVKLKTVNLDCSEIAEDFISEFGGRSILVLSKGWESQKCFTIHRCDRSEESFIYHYAWISRGGFIYDPMLGYKKDTLMDYLNQIEVNDSEVEIKIISDKNLKCYV